jgi:hypothetical protein
LPLSFPISLSACTLPSIYNLAFLWALLTPISDIFLALSRLLLFLPFPEFSYFHGYNKNEIFADYWNE